MEKLNDEEKRTYNNLIQSVLECGERVKTTLKKGISKQEEDEFQTKIKNNHNSLIKEVKTTCKDYVMNIKDQNSSELFFKYKDSQQKLYTVISGLQKDLDALREKENPILKEIVLEFQTKLKELEEYVEKVLNSTVKIPWQIRYCAERDESGTVSFSGGVIKDANGVPIWEVKCYYCGIVIEHGSEGGGTERYHCQECDKSDICYECFQIKSEVEKSLDQLKEDSRLLIEKELKEMDKHFQHFMSKENYHSVWLRNQVVTGKTPGSRILNAFKSYENRFCIGTRSKNSNSLDGYEWLTYKELGQKSMALSTNFKKLFPNRSMIGICIQNCNEWAITDFACSLIHFVLIGIHTTYESEQLVHVINNSDISVLVCNKDSFVKVSKIYKKCPKLKSLILIDKMKDLNVDLEVLFMEDLLVSKLDLDLTQIDNFPHEKPSEDAPENLYTIIYTSGSSGDPKGVMITYESFMEDTSHSIFVWPFVTPSYIPLSHSTDRLRVWETLLNGGRVGFANYDPKNWSEHESGKKKIELLNSVGSSNGVEELIEDIRFLKPTILIAPPRIWNGLYTIYLTLMSQIPKDVSKEDYEKICQEKIKKLLGGRIKHIATGGELINDYIVQFIKKCFNESQFDESYGCTECGGITMNGFSMHNVTYKILPVPELGDVENKGEIIVKSHLNSIGYYKLHHETKESFIDGYFYTGDLGEVLQDGSLKIIGRKKNFIQLEKGKYYQPDLLESIYCECSIIDQICVTHKKNTFELIFILVTRTKQDSNEVLKILKDFGEKKGLKSYLLPSEVIISEECWNLENGFLTTSLKVNRKKIQEKFLLK